MQKTHLHPIYYYRFDFDTDEALHKLRWRHKLNGNIPSECYFIIHSSEKSKSYYFYHE